MRGANPARQKPTTGPRAWRHEASNRVAARRFTKGVVCAFPVRVLMPFVCAASPETKLTTAQIRSTVVGTMFRRAPLGHDYFLDGRLERSENGRTRSGRWTAQNNQLSLLLPEVSKESPVCFDVVRVGDELQYRDAGRVVYAGAVKKRTTRLQEAGCEMGCRC